MEDSVVFCNWFCSQGKADAQQYEFASEAELQIIRNLKLCSHGRQVRMREVQFRTEHRD